MNRPTKTPSNQLDVCSRCASRSHCLITKIIQKDIAQLPAFVYRSITLRDGQYLFRKGDQLSHVYTIKFGSVKSELILRDGVSQVTNFSLPGEPLGLDGIANGHHQVDAIGLAESEVCSISYSSFKKIAERFPELLNTIEHALGTLLNSSNIHIFNLVNLNALEKLADFLIDYSNRLGSVGFDRDNFVLPMNRVDLANYLGIKNETLSRSVTQLEKINAISTQNRRIKFVSRKPIFEIMDPDSLREKHALKKAENTDYPSSLEKRKS